MVDMKVLGITMDRDGISPILVLQKKGGPEILPIWIGPSEALSISLALQGKALDRPQVHDTMYQALDCFGARLDAVNITALKEGTYYANMELSSETKRIRLDCRPSDAIALAVRARVPIRAEEDIVEAMELARAKRGGDDMVSGFMPQNPDSPEGLAVLQSMEAASSYKM